MAAGRLFLLTKYVWAVPSKAVQGRMGHNSIFGWVDAAVHLDEIVIAFCQFKRLRAFRRAGLKDDELLLNNALVCQCLPLSVLFCLGLPLSVPGLPWSALDLPGLPWSALVCLVCPGLLRSARTALVCPCLPLVCLCLPFLSLRFPLLDLTGLPSSAIRSLRSSSSWSP